MLRDRETRPQVQALRLPLQVQGKGLQRLHQQKRPGRKGLVSMSKISLHLKN
jgi:hypothetical protein